MEDFSDGTLDFRDFLSVSIHKSKTKPNKMKTLREYCRMGASSITLAIRPKRRTPQFQLLFRASSAQKSDNAPQTESRKETRPYSGSGPLARSSPSAYPCSSLHGRRHWRASSRPLPQSLQDECERRRNRRS